MECLNCSSTIRLNMALKLALKKGLLGIWYMFEYPNEMLGHARVNRWKERFQRAEGSS